ncbi:protein WVD2-like 2 isoform X2 [Iris pallida]|uniref:Protein WVD2-like 2 isoform X2 n=1 Tax=Iris pallida TaxID=29817 RepID=A0AAX6GFR6_IRIPA|nr:protein WVD2-like 2 isoform X2 [Iris pallida]
MFSEEGINGVQNPKIAKHQPFSEVTFKSSNVGSAGLHILFLNRLLLRLTSVLLVEMEIARWFLKLLVLEQKCQC